MLRVGSNDDDRCSILRPDFPPFGVHQHPFCSAGSAGREIGRDVALFRRPVGRLKVEAADADFYRQVGMELTPAE